MALGTNILAAYNLSNTTDATGNGFTLTNTGSVTFAAGLIGNAAQFGTSNSTKILTTPNVGIALADDWTVSYFWQADTALNGLSVMEIVWGTSGAGNNNRIIVGRDEGNTRWIIYNSGFTSGSTTEAITNGTWYNIIAEKSGTTVTLYINNVSKGSVAVGSTTNLTVGIQTARQDDAAWRFSGALDIWNIWNRALGTDRSLAYNGGAGVEYPFLSDLSISAVQSLTVSESVSKTLVSLVSATQAVTTTESISLFESSFISKTDSVTTSEAVTMQEVSFVSASDAVTTTESISIVEVYPLTVTDSVTTSESITKSLSVSISAADAVTSTDVPSEAVVSFISSTDSVTTSESLFLAKASTISAADSVTTGESISQSLSTSISVFDTVTESESITKLVTSFISGSDAVTASESLFLAQVFLISTSDSLTSTETVSLFSQLGISASDSISITESRTIVVRAEITGIAIMRSQSNEWPLGMDEPGSYW